METTTTRTLRRSRRTNEERSTETRTLFIEAVINSLCDVGYARSTTQEICRRAGATTGAMQHHFGSKDELVVAALDRLFSEIRDRLEAITAAPGAFVEERCRKLVRELWEAYYGQRRYAAVWEIVVGSRGEAGLHERVVHHRVESLRTLQSIWDRTFTASDGTANADALHFALSTLRGWALYGLVDQDAESANRQLEILSDTLIRLLGAAGGTQTKKTKQRVT
ncbi:TetR/AcrR family transcriptional regulator [Mesorhizobium sp. IMUNJ 23232]|uniref:TetR/AcrR family transcriptional regulator n=1 Tax=Mesorhizobium sp. IMUNJ 23232 TaxID=3376064 RepID=UPI00378D0FEE